MKIVVFVFAALLAVVTCDNHLFRHADLDRDDHLTEKEFDGIIIHWDSNTDGKVDQYEFSTGWDRDDWDDDRDSRIEFHLLDVDDDGFIAADPDLKHLFKTVDKNGDGRVSKEEFKESWEALFED